MRGRHWTIAGVVWLVVGLLVIAKYTGIITYHAGSWGFQ